MPPATKKSLRESVESLRNLSPRLNAITDLANETVRDVEAFLNDECSIGVTACIRFSYYSDDPADATGEYLEYRRVGPRFRIAVVVSDPNGQDVSVKPWADSPRETKLAAFKVLPELLAEIAKRVEDHVNEAEKTAKAVATTIAALGKPAQAERR